MEKQVKIILEKFAIECLSFDACPPYAPDYNEKDLENTMHIFMHIFGSLLFKKVQEDKMSLEDGSQLAANAGDELRQFLIKYTGIDMHKVANNH